MSAGFPVPPSEPDWPGLLRDADAALPLHAGLPLDWLAGRLVGRLVYLASPYSREVLTGGRFDPVLGEGMAAEAARWVAILAKAGITAVSPIVQAQAAVSQADGQIDPLDAGFWMRWCLPMLRACEALVVPPIHGWSRSVGVWQETQDMLRHGRAVYLLAGGAAVCGLSPRRVVA